MQLDTTYDYQISAQFSQMVWASSTRFGVGKSRSRTGKTIVVAHYYPKAGYRYDVRTEGVSLLVGPQEEGTCKGERIKDPTLADVVYVDGPLCRCHLLSVPRPSF